VEMVPWKTGKWIEERGFKITVWVVEG